MIKHFSTVLFALLLTLGLQAQVKQEALAQEYFRRGEFDKAVVLYKELREQQPNSDIIYRYYYQCQLALKEYDEMEKELKKLIKKQPDQLHFRVDLGYLYQQQGNAEASNSQYKQAVDALSANRSQVVMLSNAFTAIDQYDFAIQALETGSKLLRGIEQPFDYELANLYFKKGDKPRMIAAFLDYLQADSRNRGTVEASLQRNLSDVKEYEELQNQLYARIQRQPNNEDWTELLIWNFIQNKDFDAAFQQVRAQDRRLQEPGHRVYNFAVTAQGEKAWDAAIEAYQYLISKGRDNGYYFNARNSLIECRRQKLFSGEAYTQQDLYSLDADYRQFLKDYNRKDARSAEVIRNLAYLQAYYLFNLDTAIQLVQDVMTWPILRAAELSQAKLDLGDYLLMSGEIWEATLLYSQVDKGMKDEPLGERARFLNARLSYFSGDFSWAQGQLEVLKASTSELVANDALNLSVFISSNLDLDTSSVAMRQYARADLLAFQHRYAEASVVLDSMDQLPPEHLLADDILWLRAHMALQQHQDDLALQYLEKLSSQYAQDILADDALFALGKLYEERLLNTEKAMEAYQSLLVDHKDSIFVVEARKRFRVLRGDDVN